MPLFDLSAEDLALYRPALACPDDFDEFWGSTLAEARSVGTAVRVARRNSPLRTVEVSDVTFPGFGGHPVKAWYLRPAGVDRPLPGVVAFLGYGSGRGAPHEHLVWPSAGYATLVMDTRGQGSGWGGGGHTPDPVGSGPAAPGSMTRGIEDPYDYYYRRVFTDAVRAVDALRSMPDVDPGQVCVVGGSQGGGIALAAAGLVPDLAAVLADVPFLCHIRRAVEIAGTDPYGEVRRYLAVHRDRVDQVFRTLSYVDGANFAARAVAPALFSVALMDPVCPPSTVYAAFNAYAGDDKEIAVFEFNEHEGGGPAHTESQLNWLESHVPAQRPALSEVEEGRSI
ncbi:acetylxylan esterase [Oerskovia enterophila]|uniref:acetylxylan esterase n=1 Tax=Oerskovia enterophila TaxID=43678 RepID=UPI003398A9A6